MNKIYNKPHLFFWISLPFILGLGLNDMGESIGININDTYFMITNWELSIFISTVFVAIGLVYWALIRSGFLPIRWMTLAHMICTIDVFIILWLILNFDWFSVNSNALADYPSEQQLAVSSCLALVIVGQIIFIFNVLFTLGRNKKTNTESESKNIV